MNCPSCGQETPENGRFCTHCGQPIPVSATTGPVPTQAARLIVRRKPSFTGSARNCDIYLDFNKARTVSLNAVETIEVRPGEHAIGASLAGLTSEVIRINFQPGEEVRLLVIVNTGFLRNTLQVVRV